MRLATWNVNSVRARHERLLAWLARQRPDVLCLQELKAGDADFPLDELRAAGYQAAIHGQKTYNGVAILSRTPPADVERGLGDDVDDAQARLISARVQGLRVLSAYVPNGAVVGSPKWDYKLAWLRRLRRHVQERFAPTEPLVLCGDFNVAPEDRDVANPAAWEGSVLTHAEARVALAELLSFGLVDAFRVKRPEPGLYSWWDYRRLGFVKNDGLRLDHVFTTRALAGRVCAASIDRDERQGRQPSDHAPVIVELADG